MKVELLDNTKKKKIVKNLEKNYGIEKLNYLLLQTGKGKYRAYSGGLSTDELNLLAKNVHIEVVGAGFCKIDNEKIRLNFDILNLPGLKVQISENVLEISDEEMEKWMKGEGLDVEEDFSAGYVLVKHNGDFLGNGQKVDKFIKNYVPKERRLKSSTISSLKRDQAKGEKVAEMIKQKI